MRKRGSAGGTPALPDSQTYPYKPIKGEGTRWLLFMPDFGWLIWFAVPTSPSHSDLRQKDEVRNLHPCKPRVPLYSSICCNADISP